MDETQIILAATSAGASVIAAIINALRQGKSMDEAVQEAQDVLARSKSIDADVDATAAGKP